MPVFGMKCSTVLTAALLFGCWSATPALAQQAEGVLSRPVQARKVKGDANKMKVPPGLAGKTVPEGGKLPTMPPAKVKSPADPVAQLTLHPNQGKRDARMADAPGIDNLSDPLVNIGGLGSGSNPPDTVGDVGRNHYVQMVNATTFQVWDRQGNSLLGPLDFGALWNGFTDPASTACTGNMGDPIVVYDHLADRWLLSQFAAGNRTADGDPAAPFYMCIAISQTPDPSQNLWYLYEFETPNFPDYPKFGVWPSAYYMTSHEGNHGIYAFERDSMLLGNAARSYRWAVTNPTPEAGIRNTRLLPADLDGPPPPLSTPNYMVRTVDNRQDIANPVDRVEVFEVLASFNGNLFVFSGPATVPSTVNPNFSILGCDRNGGGIRDCIPQPMVGDTVDALSNRLMMQLKYRHFPDHDALVFNQTVDVAGSIDSLLGYTGRRSSGRALV